jgi:hypothetical protein
MEIWHKNTLPSVWKNLKYHNAGVNVTTEQCKTDYGHRWCLMCASDNPLSLGLTFRADGDGAVYGSFQSHAGLQGYDGYIHGGVISALLDSVMTHCLFHSGVRAVTGELNIRF